MVKLIDNNKAVEISINEWDDESKQYGYDWAADFFEVGSLRQVPNLSDYTDADLAELGLPPRAVIQLDDVVEPSGRIIDGIGTFGCDDDGYLVDDVDYCIEQANDMVADNIILLRITPMLPYEWSNLRRLFDCKSTFETRSGPFDYWRIRLEFDGNLIHWTVSDGWWHPKTTTFDTDYETTMTVLFDVGYDQWRKDRGIMDEADKAVKRLNDSGIPATRSSDPDYLVFEVGESVFRALLPADPTHAASRLIEAVRNRGKILDGYRKTVAGLGRVEALEADDVYWDDLFSNGDPVETGAVIFQSQCAEDHPISLDLLIMSDGTWQPDGFDSDREGTAADVRGYLSQWTGDNR